MRGAGRVVFAAIMLLIVGALNIVYGFGALDDANYFANDTNFVLDDLNTLGWARGSGSILLRIRRRWSS